MLGVIFLCLMSEPTSLKCTIVLVDNHCFICHLSEDFEIDKIGLK